MANIKLGCETYTWQMPGEQYKGKLDHIMDICAKSGFTGIEPETSFIQHLSDPVLMKETLDKYNMELAVLCLVEDWLQPTETEAERASANSWIDFLAHFPDTLLLLVQMPGADRSNLVVRQQNMLSCVNAVARRAAEKGIECSYHPNSPGGSVFRIASDYEVLINGLDAEVIGYTPDVGHIAKGGMDPLEIIKKYWSTVNCMHFKDMYKDGRWAATGEGDIDFVPITQYMVDQNYEGWIIMEDECDEAITNPDGLTLRDRIYIDDVIRPIIA